MNKGNAFLDPASHGFTRVAVAMPRVRIADPAWNAARTIEQLREAAAGGAALVAFPELGLAAYSCDDLFHQHALLEGCEAALAEVAAATRGLAMVAIVGLPLRVEQLLYNCAAVLHEGRVLGIVPKSYLPNYAEFYEARQFNPAGHAGTEHVLLGGERVPFGSQLLFESVDRPLLKLHVEICEDVWVPIPPSSFAALAGATVLVNLSASNITIGKAAYRRQLASGHSARCLAAYLYTSAGIGESTTDMAWDGQALIYENGVMLAESPRFDRDGHLSFADVDLDLLAHERMRQTSFGASVARHRDEVQAFRRVEFKRGGAVPATVATTTTTASTPAASRRLARPLERFPYVPFDPARRDERCQEVYNIQLQGLVQRLEATGIDKLVIGISGGLDSTHALQVCLRAMDWLGKPRANVLGYTMPAFATSQRTLGQARALMQAAGCSAAEIDIRPSCLQMLKDIGHPFAEGEPFYDVAFENVQAGERTSHLFRLANQHGALVAGTGDLSELALGWCTYGVGDHMSHYNVNASVPKTLIKHLVRWLAETSKDAAERQVLLDVLDTEISPELVPGDAGGQPTQSTEGVLGPYELHDFFLYHVLRYGFAPSKVAYLAWQAWRDAGHGQWPDSPLVAHNQYTLADIKRHLTTFVRRFFQTSQFKRSCAPNAPKVGSGGSLSPRGDWRAPSDSSAALWLAELARVPDEEPPAATA